MLIHFALQLALFKIQRHQRSEMHWMTSDRHFWTINCQMNPLYTVLRLIFKHLCPLACVVCVWHSSLLLHVAVCLSRGGCWLVVRSLSSLSSLPDPFFLDCLSRACQTCTPQFSILLSLLHPCFRSAAGQWFCGRLLSHAYQSTCVYSFPGSLQQTPRISVSADPFWAARNHNPTRTAAIFIYVDSFIQALTAKHKFQSASLCDQPFSRYRLVEK